GRIDRAVREGDVLGKVEARRDRTASQVLTVEVAGQARPGVCPAGEERELEAVAVLKLDRRVLTVEGVAVADDPEIEGITETVLDLPSRRIRKRGIKVVPVAVNEVDLGDAPGSKRRAEPDSIFLDVRGLESPLLNDRVDTGDARRPRRSARGPADRVEPREHLLQRLRRCQERRGRGGRGAVDAGSSVEPVDRGGLARGRGGIPD